MRGGFRQGAGRKKGFAAKTAEEARRLLAQRVAAEIGPLIDILIAKAKKGDIRALHELFDRAWGRAPQGIMLTTQYAKDSPEDKSHEEMLQLGQLYDQVLKLQITKDISFEEALSSFKPLVR